MAQDTEAPPDDETAAGGKKKMLIVIVATAVIVLVAAGLLVKMLLVPQEPAKDPKLAAGAIVALAEDMTLNLSDGKYLKLKMSLQLNEDATAKAGGEKGLKAFDGSMARDAAIDVLGHYTMAELLQPDNKDKARDALSKEVTTRYDGDVIKVYFTDFVMQ